MQTQKIVFTGGPATGKSSTLKKLNQQGFHCLNEVSRQITADAQAKGIAQLFLKDPLLFSQKLLEGRIKQYKQANLTTEKICFFDRGIPEIAAYMEYKNENIPQEFLEANKKHRYDYIFIFPIWDDIYISDKERYESLSEAKKIDKFIRKTYKDLGYKLIEVPRTSVEKRAEFILNHINYAFSK